MTTFPPESPCPKCGSDLSLPVGPPPAEVEELVAWLKSRAEMSSDEAEFLGEHEQDGWAADNAADAKKFTATASALTSLSLRVKELEEALRDARQFIVNGRSFGYIRIPPGDPAQMTLPRIEA
jgi:hypothetical protein